MLRFPQHEAPRCLPCTCEHQSCSKSKRLVITRLDLGPSRAVVTARSCEQLRLAFSACWLTLLEPQLSVIHPCIMTPGYMRSAVPFHL